MFTEYSGLVCINFSDDISSMDDCQIHKYYIQFVDKTAIYTLIHNKILNQCKNKSAVIGSLSLTFSGPIKLSGIKGF